MIRVFLILKTMGVGLIGLLALAFWGSIIVGIVYSAIVSGGRTALDWIQSGRLYSGIALLIGTGMGGLVGTFMVVVGGGLILRQYGQELLADLGLSWPRRRAIPALPTFWAQQLQRYQSLPMAQFWPLFAGARLAPIEGENGNGHILVRGRTDSGKSLCIEMLMQPVLNGIAANYLAQAGGIGALWHDHKGQSFQLLRGQGVPSYILNPYDERGYAWAISEDVKTREAARQLARFLIPSKSAKDQYWVGAPRSILRVAMSYLIDRKDEVGTDWDLLDLLTLVEQPRVLRDCCQDNPEARRVLSIFEAARSGGDVYASLLHNLDEIRDLALCWRFHRVHNRTLSLNHWVKSLGSVVLLGPVTRSASVEAANRLVFSWVSSVIFRLPDNPYRQIWFVFDELNAFEKPLEALPGFLAYSRSKGGRFVAGVHDEADFEDTYGKGRTSKIFNNFAHVCILKSGLATAKWAEEFLGKRWVWETSYSHSHGNNGSWSQGSQRRQVLQPYVMAHEVTNMVQPSRRRGLQGIYKSPIFESLPGEFTWFRYTGEQVERLRPRRAAVPGLMPIEESRLQQAARMSQDLAFRALPPGTQDRSRQRNLQRREDASFPHFLTDVSYDPEGSLSEGDWDDGGNRDWMHDDDDGRGRERF